MHLTQLQLTNLKGFRELDFDLTRPDGSSPAGWTVFVGDNGSGKSTLLKAIALCLVGPEIARALQPSLKGWIHSKSGAAKATVELEGSTVHGDDRSRGRHVPKGQLLKPALSILNGDREARAEWLPRDPLTPDVLWSGNIEDSFSCGYGPLRRLSGSSGDAERLMSAEQTARFATMFSESASLSETDVWLRRLNHRSLEGHAGSTVLLRQFIELLNDELLPNSMRVEEVNSDGLWLLDCAGTRLSWSEMSDGYRSVIALVGDLIRHLYRAAGNGENLPSSSIEHLRERSGVVLIDEVEAHLHPEWQREIGFWLKRQFPNIQFLVTTHSPLVCQAADSGGLFHLPEPGRGDEPRKLSEEERIEIRNSRADTILRSSAFGLSNTRSDEVVEQRQKFANLSVKKRTVGTLLPAEEQELEAARAYVSTDEEL